MRPWPWPSYEFCRWEKNPVHTSLYYLESNLQQSTEKVTGIHSYNGSALWFGLINGLVQCIMLILPRNLLCCCWCRPVKLFLICVSCQLYSCVMSFILRIISQEIFALEKQWNQIRSMAHSQLLNLSCHLSWGVACILHTSDSFSLLKYDKNIYFTQLNGSPLLGIHASILWNISFKTSLINIFILTMEQMLPGKLSLQVIITWLLLWPTLGSRYSRHLFLCKSPL